MNRMNGTRFAEVEELKKALTEIRLADEHFQAGGVPLTTEMGRAWVDDTDSHTIVFGATGSKKTRALVIPAVDILSRADESFVVTDPKGEIYKATAGGLEERGYHVMVLNFRDYEKGTVWNPLLLPYRLYKNGETPKAVEMVSSIADMLLGDPGKDDAYWFNTAKDVGVGLLLYLFEKVEWEGQCNIKSLLRIWQGYLADKEAFLKGIRKQHSGTIIADKLQCLDNKSERTVGSIEAVFATGINRFSTNEKLIDYLSQPGFDPESMVADKMAVYIIIPDEVKFYNFLVSLFLKQHYEATIREAQKWENNTLGIRVNYIVDEFANLPKIENMEAMITASRSRNIRFVLIVQSMNQLVDKYGDVTQVICSNCNNWIYLYSKEYDLLTQISRLCGEVIYDNNMRMPLISEFDLQHLDKEKGEALVLCGRNYPCIVNLMDMNDYPFARIPCREECHSIEHVYVVGEADDRSKNKNRYRYPLDEQDVAGWHNRTLSCKAGELSLAEFISRTEEKDKKSVALFATFQGMVMKVFNVSREDCATGRAIMEKSLSDFNIAEAAGLQWYRDFGDGYFKYQMLLGTRPEKVYITVDELRDNKVILKECENCFAEWVAGQEKRAEKYACELLESNGEWSIKLKTSGEENRVLFEKTIPGYAGTMGLIYSSNLAQREANMALRGTEFDKAFWMSIGTDLSKEKATMYLRKRADRSNKYALLEMEFHQKSNPLS